MIICSVCGKEAEKAVYGKSICSHECFVRRFWQEKIDRKDEYVVIDGVCYYVGPENDRGYFRGFSGQMFIIRMNDGKLITTTNLWHQGVIPDEYRDQLPNNAVFVEEL